MNAFCNCSPPKPRRGVIDILMPIAILLVLVALLIPAIIHARQTAGESTETTATGVTQVDEPTDLSSHSKSDAATDSAQTLLSDSEFALALVAACFAAIAWYYNKLQEQFTLRSELAVVEVLSDGVERTRTELAAVVKRANPSVRFVPGAFTDALASLVSKGAVVVTQGKFKNASKS